MQVLTGTLGSGGDFMIVPEDVIDNIALDMANEGLIETNFYDVNGMWGFAGFRRIRKTWKEKIMCRLSK